MLDFALVAFGLAIFVAVIVVSVLGILVILGATAYRLIDAIQCSWAWLMRHRS